MTISTKSLAKLRGEATVAYVEEDVIAKASGGLAKGSCPSAGASGRGGGSTTQPSETTPWGISAVGGQTGTTGAGVKVAVVDTGIDLDHPDLAANVKTGVNYTGASPDDDNGHGSHVAGTIAAVDNTIGVIGVAPGASLYPVKVLDRRGSGYLSDVAAGIDWCRNNGIHIANMSLGGSSSTSTLDTACSNAKNAGVLLVAAAGNSGDGNTSTTETSYPAAYDSVLSVGAVDSLDRLASFSNSGAYVDLAAPGVSVYSTTKGASYATYNGTSMASPHVAGVAALVWALDLTNSTASSVDTALRGTYRRTSGSWNTNGYGAGIVDYVP
ncbi:MAG: S8 family peptidase [Planctomycetia bacterium]